MYAALGIIKNSKQSGKLIGTHQRLDKAARLMLSHHVPEKTMAKFPGIKEILYFEGSRGPDGLKRKSPGVDEPDHFIIPHQDDGILIGYIRNHQYNLRAALAKKDRVRASFEAAWMAHAITDGLTPAHHYPYRQVVDELMTDKDYKRLFGIQIKGIMRGDNMAQAIRNNWLYWGAGGVMTKHIAFEYGVAYTISAVPLKRLMPKDVKAEDFQNVDLEHEFYRSLEKIASMDMYTKFIQTGWNTQLVVETRDVLIPEIVRMIALGWASCMDAQYAKPQGGQNEK